MNFARKVTRVARRQYARGRITLEQYEQVKEASKDPEIVAEWRDKVEREVYGAPWLNVKGTFDFTSIWEWFIEHWDEILQILLTILPLFLGEEKEDED